MKRILVGFDGSPHARGALRWAGHVAGPLGAELVAVNAWSPGQAELPPQEAGEEHGEAEDALAAALAGEAPQVDSRRAEVVDGDPVDVILERAAAEDVDLIAVGLRGAGGFAGLRLGSVADALAHRTTRPLAIVPDDPPLGVRRVVLGLDGSEGSAAAASWCARFVPALAAEVTATHVHTQQLELLPEVDPHSVVRYVEHALRTEWIAPLRDAGVPFHTEFIREHHAAEALADEAERADAQVIVVGTHGLAPLLHLRLGGVAMQLLHAAPVPVVLVPPRD